MGIIKKILGALLGIVAAIGGLVGLGKKGGGDYYLDLSGEDAKAAKPAQVASAAPAPAAKTAPVAPAAAPASASAEAAPTTAEATAENPEPAGAEVAAEPAPEPTFAELMQTPMVTLRTRRPGPSLAGFQDMAKGMRIRA